MTARVLVVDDASVARRYLRAVLEHSGLFELAGEADDGVLAVEMAAALQPDMVTLDMSMPGTDGSSALGAILRAAPGARVVVVSAMDESLAGPLLAAGASAFIPKGLSPRELLARFEGVLDASTVA